MPLLDVTDELLAEWRQKFPDIIFYEAEPLNLLRDAVYATAKEHGWWDLEPVVQGIEGFAIKPNIPEKLALIHSEISEALEEYRTDEMGVRYSQADGFSNKPEGFPIELADAIIRILDLCGYLNIDIEEAVRVKAEYNRTRPYRHGGKKC